MAALCAYPGSPGCTAEREEKRVQEVGSVGTLQVADAVGRALHAAEKATLGSATATDEAYLALVQRSLRAIATELLLFYQNRRVMAVSPVSLDVEPFGAKTLGYAGLDPEPANFALRQFYERFYTRYHFVRQLPEDPRSLTREVEVQLEAILTELLPTVTAFRMRLYQALVERGALSDALSRGIYYNSPMGEWNPRQETYSLTRGATPKDQTVILSEARVGRESSWQLVSLQGEGLVNPEDHLFADIHQNDQQWVDKCLEIVNNYLSKTARELQNVLSETGNGVERTPKGSPAVTAETEDVEPEPSAKPEVEESSLDRLRRSLSTSAESSSTSRSDTVRGSTGNLPLPTITMQENLNTTTTAAVPERLSRVQDEKDEQTAQALALAEAIVSHYREVSQTASLPVRLAGLIKLEELVEVELRATVDEARENDYSWRRIARHLGLGQPSAFKRFDDAARERYAARRRVKKDNADEAPQF